MKASWLTLFSAICLSGCMSEVEVTNSASLSKTVVIAVENNRDEMPIYQVSNAGLENLDLLRRTDDPVTVQSLGSITVYGSGDEIFINGDRVFPPWESGSLREYYVSGDEIFLGAPPVGSPSGVRTSFMKINQEKQIQVASVPEMGNNIVSCGDRDFIFQNTIDGSSNSLFRVDWNENKSVQTFMQLPDGEIYRALKGLGKCVTDERGEESIRQLFLHRQSNGVDFALSVIAVNAGNGSIIDIVPASVVGCQFDVAEFLGYGTPKLASSGSIIWASSNCIRQLDLESAKVSTLWSPSDLRIESFDVDSNSIVVIGKSEDQRTWIKRIDLAGAKVIEETVLHEDLGISSTRAIGYVNE